MRFKYKSLRTVQPVDGGKANLGGTVVIVMTVVIVGSCVTLYSYRMYQRRKKLKRALIAPRSLKKHPVSDIEEVV